MLKANQTYKALFLLTLLFVLLAIASFAAFGVSNAACDQATNCIQTLPSNKSDIFWDVFTNRLLSFIGLF